MYLPANHLGDEGAAVLAAAADPARPVWLGLGGNEIGPAGARALAEALEGIEALDLGRPPSERSLGALPNATGDSGAHALAEALRGSPLRRLELCHTGLTGRGAKTLLAAVDADSHLEYVGLGPGLPRKVKRLANRPPSVGRAPYRRTAQTGRRHGPAAVPPRRRHTARHRRTAHGGPGIRWFAPSG